MVFLLFFILLVLFIIAYRCFDCDLASPSLHFIGGFLICSLVALVYREEWSMDKLHIGTCMLIILSCFVFFVTEYLYKAKVRHKINRYSYGCSLGYYVHSWKLVFFILLQLYSYYMMYKFTISVSTASDSLSEALADLDHQVKYEDETFYAPWYVNIPNTICQCAGYAWCCLFPYYYIMFPTQYKKEKALFFLNFTLTILGSLLTGSRGNLVTYLISMAIFFFIVFKFKNGKKSKIPQKVKIAVVSFATFFSLGFMTLGELIGRELNTDISSQDMFAAYCGAQIKNLDDYLYTEVIKEERQFGVHVFSNMINNISSRTGVKPSIPVNKTTEFNVVNGYFLGNVRSALVDYYVDFKWSGLLCVAFFSLIMSKLYYGIYRCNFLKNGQLNYWLLFYSWLAFTPFLSFFGEKFYSRFTIDGLVRFSLAWIFIITFLQGRIASYNFKLNSRIK